MLRCLVELFMQLVSIVGHIFRIAGCKILIRLVRGSAKISVKALVILWCLLLFSIEYDLACVQLNFIPCDVYICGVECRRLVLWLNEIIFLSALKQLQVLRLSFASWLLNRYFVER